MSRALPPVHNRVHGRGLAAYPAPSAVRMQRLARPAVRSSRAAACAYMAAACCPVCHARILLFAAARSS
eukprot:scaffold276_cov116-Isochrysis_galbana.AAC.7